MKVLSSRKDNPLAGAAAVPLRGTVTAKRGAAGDIAFNHAMVYVKDVRRALRFYRDGLGLRVIEAYDDYARLRFPLGPSTLGLHVMGKGMKVSRRDPVRLYFEARNLGAVVKRLRARGGKILQPPKLMPWGWRHAYVLDPDGHEISVYWAGRRRFQKTM